MLTLTSITFLQLELTILHVATHTLSSNHCASSYCVPVVTTLHKEWLILGTTYMPKSDSFKSLNALKKFLGVCNLSNFLIYKYFSSGCFYLLSKLYLFNSVHLYIITFTRTFTVHSLRVSAFSLCSCKLGFLLILGETVIVFGRSWINKINK